MVALGAVYLYLTFADLLPSAYVGETGPTEIIYGMLLGGVAGWFWLFLVAGTILPIVLVALPWTRNIWGTVIASLLVVIAMWIKRVIMVIETSGYDTLTNSFDDALPLHLGLGDRDPWWCRRDPPAADAVVPHRSLAVDR